jgi:hypothetical protein
LSFERGAAPAGSSGGLLDVERLIGLAQARGVASNPVVRDQLARLIIEMRVMSLTIRRARDTALTGQPGPAGSGLKLRGSRTFREYTNLALAILGPDALTVTEPWHTLFLTAPSLSIRGRTRARSPRGTSPRPGSPLRSAPPLTQATRRQLSRRSPAV